MHVLYLYDEQCICVILKLRFIMSGFMYVMHFILFCLVLHCKDKIVNTLVKTYKDSTISWLFSVLTPNAIVNLHQLYAIIIDAQNIYGNFYSFHANNSV